MSQKINEKELLIQKAYGVTLHHINGLGAKMADICAEAQMGREPSGFLAKKIQETFNHDDLEIIATMFMIKTINEENIRAMEEVEECQCPNCRAKRGEEDDVQAHVIRIPKGGITNC